MCVAANCTFGGYCCVCECVRDVWRNVFMCVCVSLGVPQPKPAVYHRNIPRAISKFLHARFRLLMTESQEGHMVLCCALCNRTWTFPLFQCLSTQQDVDLSGRQRISAAQDRRGLHLCRVSKPFETRITML